ncbi:MAG: peptidase T [Bacteroidota bacterium]
MLENIKERFFCYVKIDTQSDPHSAKQPSTEKQKNLSKILVKELLEMGIKDAHLDEYGYVYATIPSNSVKKNIPTICFCSHVDTSPDCSGENVKPILHKNYNGDDLILPDDNTIVIRKSEHPDLENQIGNDIITASGTTLLGADNKAGVTAIMMACQYLIEKPHIKHGIIKILFTPDEEIGRGTNFVNIEKLGAKYGYTVDGESLGSIENETFSADGMKVIIHGVSQHPGFAKNRMESSIKIASEIVAALPKDKLSPETTEGMQGFIHPVGINGQVETTEIELIIRDFETEGLQKLEDLVKNITHQILVNYPNSTAEFHIHEQYRNMKVILDNHPQIINIAKAAMVKSGLKPHLQSIRGGTDGSRLSFMGLPCPNIFAGEHAFHSKQEWVSLQDIHKAMETIVNICEIWESESE